MSVLGWVAVGVGAWCVLSVAVALAVGRAIRLRDRQAPRPDRFRPADRCPGNAPPDPPVTGIPEQRRAPDPARDRGPEVRGS